VLAFFGTPRVLEPSPGQLSSDAGLLAYSPARRADRPVHRLLRDTAGPGPRLPSRVSFFLDGLPAFAKLDPRVSRPHGGSDGCGATPREERQVRQVEPYRRLTHRYGRRYDCPREVSSFGAGANSTCLLRPWDRIPILSASPTGLESCPTTAIAPASQT